MQNVVIPIKSVFNKNHDHYYNETVLEKCLKNNKYLKIIRKCHIMIQLTFLKVLILIRQVQQKMYYLSILVLFRQRLW